MIGIIVTGHGNFATGLTSGLKLLAGDLEYYAAVDFAPEDSMEELNRNLKDGFKQLESCEAIVVFADLTGGSPFNVASRMKLETKGRLVEVAGGTNLPVLLNAYLTRGAVSGAAELAELSLAAGKEQMIRVRTETDKAAEDELECEEYEEE